MTSDPPEGPSHGREAARYRRRLREVEGERDSLAAQNARLRADVVELALRTTAVPGKLETLRHPGDLVALGGADPDDLFDAEGGLDHGKVTIALTDLHRRRPDLFEERPGSDDEVEPLEPSLADLLRIR